MIMNDGMMIFIIFGLLIMLPIIVTAAILCVIKHRRSRKKKYIRELQKDGLMKSKSKDLTIRILCMLLILSMVQNII